jgi:hypothetical protein
MDAAPNSTARRWFVSLLTVGLLLRLLLACISPGIAFSDEHQQYIEQSFRLLHGYGVTFWEQDYGMRHPLFPTILAGVLWAGERAGIHNPHVLAALQRFLMVLISYGAMAYLAWSLFVRGGRTTALALAALLVLCVDLVFIQIRVMSETACVATLALALALWPRRPIAVGILLGLMIALRLQAAPLALGFCSLAIWTDWRSEQPRTNMRLIVGLACSLLATGWWDRCFYGNWFHSFIALVDQNWVADQASGFGRSPAYTYLFFGLRRMLGASVFALAFLAWGARRRCDLAFLAIPFIVAHSLIPHKEQRFLWPLVPIGCLLLAEGFADLYQRCVCRSRLALGAVITSLVIGSAIRLPRLEWRTEPYASSCQALAWISRQHDVHGVALIDIHPWESGNFFYLRSHVPLRFVDGQQKSETDRMLRDGEINYVVVPQSFLPVSLAQEFECVAARPLWTVYKRTGKPAATMSAHRIGLGEAVAD